MRRNVRRLSREVSEPPRPCSADKLLCERPLGSTKLTDYHRNAAAVAAAVAAEKAVAKAVATTNRKRKVSTKAARKATGLLGDNEGETCVCCGGGAVWFACTRTQWG